MFIKDNGIEGITKYCICLNSVFTPCESL